MQEARISRHSERMHGTQYKSVVWHVSINKILIEQNLNSSTYSDHIPQGVAGATTQHEKSSPWLKNGAAMAAAFASKADFSTCFDINQRFIVWRTLNTTISTKYHSLDMKRIDFRFSAILTTRRSQYKTYVITTTQKRGACAQSKRIVHIDHPNR